ncbi:hypothetical protein [Enterococcus sp. DIV0660C]|uniref:hypothetical protein n=1 Tax=Enterococcus sp. DIV0660C TaxID=2230880 RepID=UPI001A8D3A5D|nr:hypothetical protein [Enterococcus sp. DIV0660C]MBO0432287.1 hypothetical protein [Enterococcus sp. DIV0660C]
MKIMLDELVFTEEKLKLAFEVDILQPSEYEYAYYLYQDGKVIKRIWYQTSSSRYQEIVEVPLFSGSYQIRLFVKYKEKIILNQQSNLLWISVEEKKTIPSNFNSERVYFNDHPVKFVLQESKNNSPYLVISFSGLYSTEFQGGPPVYNHIRTLETIDTNKLFILDSFEEQFCYYVGFGGSKEFERSVFALIMSVANRLKIPVDNIIATGSSKGGSAALYFSIKYYFGHAIIGAPQIYISKYLQQRANSKSMRKRYYKLLGKDRKFGQAFWNNLILNQVIMTDQFPNLHFHVGEGDFHYEQHLKPLLNLFEKKEVDYSLDLKLYDDHSQTGLYFTPFLQNKIHEIIQDKENNK